MIVTQLYELNDSGATSLRTKMQASTTGFSYLAYNCAAGNASSEEVAWVAID